MASKLSLRYLPSHSIVYLPPHFTAMKHLLLLLLCGSTAIAQTLVPVTDEILTVNSSTAMVGITRNSTEVRLPTNSKSYVYRITVIPKGRSAGGTSLFDLLKMSGDPTLAVTGSVAKFAVSNGDNSAVDAFIFTNSDDNASFMSKRDGDWTPCRQMLNRGNCCFSTTSCMGQHVFFAFRNNNVMQGLNVRVEIVALTDDASVGEQKYSYTITNATDREIKYQIKDNSTDWREMRLSNGYTQNMTGTSPYMYITIQTDAFKKVSYRIESGVRHKIIWNQLAAKWDLVRY